MRINIADDIKLVFVNHVTDNGICITFISGSTCVDNSAECSLEIALTNEQAKELMHALKLHYREAI